MNDLPKQDQPDEIWIGPVGPIPVHYADDPRLDSERRAWKEAATRVDGLNTPDELLEALSSDEWQVRVWVIDRLMARASNDGRLVPALIDHLIADPAWEVRARIAIKLTRYPGDRRVNAALHKAQGDSNSEVRESVTYALEQISGEPNNNRS